MYLNISSKESFLSNFHKKTATPKPSEIKFYAPCNTHLFAFIKVGERFPKLAVKS